MKTITFRADSAGYRFDAFLNFAILFILSESKSKFRVFKANA